MDIELTAHAGENGTAVLRSIRRVHLIAIGGVGMGALAGMLKQRGLEVSGSDEKLYPPMSEAIARLAIPIDEGYRAENLGRRPDLVVIGNKVSRGNPEVAAVLSGAIPYLSFPESLAKLFLAGRRSVVVAGTHGKTSCTAMLAWVLERAGRDPSVMVGGQSLDFGGNFKLGDGECFVVEGDEYDSAFFDKGPKFLHYRPDAALLNAVEYDHADIYPDLDAVKDAFRRFVALLPGEAPLVVASEFPHALDVAESAARARVVTFGASETADWRLSDFADQGGRVRFSVLAGGRWEGSVEVALAGLLNARNALGVYVLARHLGLGHDEIAPGLASFSGVARRMEVVGELGGVLLIDDFAHHPTAVRETLAAVRGRHAGRRVWALFEPRSNTTRRKVFQSEYVKALAGADLVVVGGVFQKESDRVDAAGLFSPEQLVSDLRRAGVSACAEPDPTAIAALVGARAAPGDVVLIMSNGDFGGLRRRLVETLGRRGPATV